ncbi:MAG: toll/interleukin-1 receptor domain-containing protein [Chthoniobacterales bacterium]
MSDDSRNWGKLLQAIADGNVIPIVGRGLLRIQVDGREQFLYDYLATQLASRLEVKCDPAASIDQVVAAYLHADEENERGEVTRKTLEILNSLQDADGRFPVPDPLRKLADIEPLRLFLSTTVDPLLAKALGSPDDHVFFYSPNADLKDIPRGYAGLPNRVVFHLFGKSTGLPTDSALIDEETLEFIWKLHDESSTRLANLFDELRNKRLLLIGNSHPDWLARFFLRLARKERLNFGDKRTPREFVADGAVVGDARLRDFLENFSPQTKSFGVANPIEFVDQLAERWDAFPGKPPPRKLGAPLARASAKPPAVFISYASQDHEAVERLQDMLGRAGLDVWFDKTCLQSGDSWWSKIEEKITTCDVFIPVISANTNQRYEGVFIREWNRALDRLRDMDRANARFIHPVIIDDTAEGAVTFGGFREFHYARAAGGEPQSDLIKTLTAIVRERRLKAASQ